MPLVVDRSVRTTRQTSSVTAVKPPASMERACTSSSRVQGGEDHPIQHPVPGVVSQSVAGVARVRADVPSVLVRLRLDGHVTVVGIVSQSGTVGRQQESQSAGALVVSW